MGGSPNYVQNNPTQRHPGNNIHLFIQTRAQGHSSFSSLSPYTPDPVYGATCEKTGTVSLGLLQAFRWLHLCIRDMYIGEKYGFRQYMLFDCSLFHKLHCTSVSAQAPFVFVLPKILQEIGEYVLIAWHFPISCGEV
jgi:hypothetical protein